MITHQDALTRICERGLDVASVIDVGAARGEWSLMAREFWPNARFHLIEAFDHWAGQLESLVSQQRNFSYSAAAAGAEDGEIWFWADRHSPYGGRAYDHPGPGRWCAPMVCIDSEVRKCGLEAPFLIKLDTHGYERAILNGARQTIPGTNLLVMETYNFGDKQRQFAPMTLFAEGLGFRCIDIGEPLWRQYDQAFWQLDLFFIPATRPEFNYDGYR